MNKIIAIVCHKVTAPLVHTVEYLSSYNDNTVILHVDAKSNVNEFVFLSKTNVIILENRVDIQWGRFSQIAATLKLMEFSLKFNYSYFFLISGDDIPVMSNDTIDAFLNDHMGKEFIHYQDSRNSYVDPEERVKYLYPEAFYNRTSSFRISLTRKFHKIFKNILFINKSFTSNQHLFPKLFKGTNWFTLTKDAVQFIVEYTENNKAFVSVFQHSLCADEVFFHSILKTKPDINIYHNDSAINDALRYIDWVSGPEYPRVLNVVDQDKIKESRALFARKISPTADQEFMNSFIRS